MRIVRYVGTDGKTGAGIEHADGMVEPCKGSVYDGLKPSGKPMRPKRILAPVEPVNLFCIGLNYREHAAESKMPIPQYPVVFMKPTTSVIGPGHPIVLPRVCDPAGEVDYECELAVVIGRAAKNVPVSKALEHVLGYTCGNDVSARRWQARLCGGQWVRGKSFDGFCPLGPALVTADEIPDPQALGIKTVLNGKVMQQHTTGDMIFSVAQLIAFLSEDTTLLPGTVIITGTPQGVGFVRQPPVWLKAGDEVVVEVEKIGRLVNKVVGTGQE